MNARPLSLAPFALLLVAACGGATVSGGVTSGNDGGTTRDAVSTVDAVALGDGGCVVSPVVGGACDPGVSAACVPENGDPCCTGYVWFCDPTSKSWQQEGLGCACRVDAGSPPDTGASKDASPGLDAATDASDACGGCPSGDVCVTSTSSGGVCLPPSDAGVCPNGSSASPGTCCDNTSTTYQCQPRPSSCGSELTCGCAASLCPCMCTGASGSSVSCACEFP